ncbi:MAG: DNA recombination protein RmuC [Marinibacterium sp.]|nr:DNA recombination protein RmuC [Marinibacterium sp.]
MIQIGTHSVALDDPAVLAVGGIVVAILLLLILSLRASARAARMIEPLTRHIATTGQNITTLGKGQEQLRGSLASVSDAQANGQAQMTLLMEQRMGEVQVQLAENLGQTQIRMQQSLSDLQLKTQRSIVDLQERMNESLQGNAKRTATSLAVLQERLATIDKAQDNITKLSGDVLGLQDILSNRQTRGAFGEIQLRDILSKALPADSYAWQPTLSNGKRADCLIHLPNPPGPIVIDSKFPLEAYEALRAAGSDAEVKQAVRDLRTAFRAHIRAIADKYIIDGETADGALMFLPSEAVYAELHANFADIVREGFDARVWTVSPTTCMATLNTMRAILKDARMREQAGAIRKALKQLHRDVELIEQRAGKLETHLRQAGDDVSGILTAASRAGKRAERLDNFDFEEIAPDDPEASAPVQIERIGRP